MAENQPLPALFTIAVVGCTHGELDLIYERILQSGRTVDLLLCCGDFQAIRDSDDLQTIACPVKYRRMGDFEAYHKGTKVAPVLTIFIGGNHESAGLMWQLPYGGWVAPNIFYIGHSGVVEYAGLKIAGISGIFKPYDFEFPHYEKAPLRPDDIHSFHHQRSIDCFRLLQIKSGSIDIFMSHDWPNDITDYGDKGRLLREKKHFESDVRRGELGSPALRLLLHKLQPQFYFAGHMHCLFRARVNHPDSSRVTDFVALDKALPRRNFLEFVEIQERSADRILSFHLPWLSVLKQTDVLAPPSLGKRRIQLPVRLPIGKPPIALNQQSLSLLERFDALDPQVLDEIQRQLPKDAEGRVTREIRFNELDRAFPLFQTANVQQIIQSPFLLGPSPVEYDATPQPREVICIYEKNPEEIDLDE